MPKFKHIIWDWNGTLFDDAKLCFEIINEILADNGLKKVTFEKYLDVFTFPVKNYYAALGLPVENGEFEKLGKIFIDEYERRKFRAGLHKDSLKTLEKFYSKGVGQSALSAYSQDKLENILNHFGLKKYFSEIAGLDNIYAAGKIEIGKKLIDKLGLKKDEALLIGDTLHDAEVAREIGANVILIAHGHQSERRLRNSGEKVVSSFDELTAYVCEED